MKEDILNDILMSVYHAGKVIAIEIAQKHNVTTQTIFRKIKLLLEQKQIEKIEKNKYKLIKENSFILLENKNLKEDIIWSKNILPLLPPMHNNALKSLCYIFTEMLNNAIEHSESDKIDIILQKSAVSVSIDIFDYGIGIFEKIRKSMGLEEKRFAVLELAKGKFTTDEKRHSGEGVFFSSKIADVFCIFSDDIVFLSTENKGSDTHKLIENNELVKGTSVFFEILLNHSKDNQLIFEKYYSNPEDFTFNKTKILVKLLEHGDPNPFFVSRSQARRLLARFEKFENIELDFTGIQEIGQGFADEIFRVFKNENPNIKIISTKCNETVLKMIKHVQ